MVESITRRRSASVHCSTIALRVLRKPAKLVSTVWMAERLVSRPKLVIHKSPI